MKTSNNPFVRNLPGYLMTRAELATKREQDRKSRQGSVFDGIGVIAFLDSEKAFVIPASELRYLSPEQVRNLGIPQLTKLVVSESGGVLCTATGHVDETWLRTLSKVALPMEAQQDKHFTKCFSPGYEGPIVGYHAIRAGDRLNVKTFEQVSGQPIASLDFVNNEGKAQFAATTQADFRNPKSTVYLREAPIKALQGEQHVDQAWKKASFCEGRNITSLRGTVQNGKVQYTFLDLDAHSLMTASPTDKSAKSIMENVKGVLTPVTGAQQGQNMATVAITDQNIVSVDQGRDDQVIADFSNPAYAELGRWIRQAHSLNGILGKGEIYASSVGNPLAGLMVAKATPSYEARA